MDKIKRVMLDMDGVMVDFLAGLHRALGAPYSIDNYPYELGKWNMLTDIKPFEDIPATFEECNACCDVSFWENLEWIHDGKEILELVESKFDEIYLLTTPMPNPGSATGKMLWVEKHIPKYKNKLIITSVSKSLLANESSVLIDDRDKNVEEFSTAGGYGVLVPRPWNNYYTHRHCTLDVVESSILDIKEMTT